jgi:PAS domain S-box-containing protein
MNDFAAFPAIDFRALFQTLAMPAAVLDASFNFAHVNAAFEARFEYLRYETVGRSFLSTFDPNIVETVRHNCELLRALDTPQLECERRVITRSGAAFDALIQVQAFETAGERFYSVLYHDVNAARERERLLFSRAEMFRLTIEQSPLPISIQDENFRIVLVNKAYCDFLGYTEAELLGRDPVEFLIAPGERLEIPHQRQAIRGSNLDELPRFTMVREAIHRDGRRIPYRLELGHSRGIDGRPLWCAMIIDLSKIEQTKTRLDAQIEMTAQVQSRFDMFAHCVDEAVLVVDAQSQCVRHANAAVRKVFGLDPAQLVNGNIRRVWDTIDDASQPALREALAHLEQGQHSEAMVVVDGGVESPSTVRVRLFRGGERWPEYFVLAEDVTESLRLEKQRLREALDQREALVREVHHRIKNNLQGTAGLLRRAELKAPSLGPVIDELAGQIHAIAHVHGLQVDNGDAPGPEQLVRAIADSRASTFGRTWAFRHEPAAGAPRWALSESQGVPMALVINELVTNAFKHGEPGRDVEVDVRTRPQGVAIRIANAGRLERPVDLKQPVPIATGMGLLKALIPSRGASLAFWEEGGRVIAELVLSEPAIRSA